MTNTSIPSPPSVSYLMPQLKISLAPNPSPIPAQCAQASLSARDVVLDIVGKLRAQGHLNCLEISPMAGLSEHGPSTLFDLVVSAFLVETEGIGYASHCPVPVPALECGHKIELLPLYLSVRSCGGFHAVAESMSWAAVAMDIGLDQSTRLEVELMYALYIAPLELKIQNQGVDSEMVDVSGDFDQRLDSCAPAASTKRKRGDLVRMLNWVRLVAKSPGEPNIIKQISNNQVSKTVRLRHKRYANIDCRPLASWRALVGMSKWVRLVANNPRVVVEDHKKHFSTTVQLRHRMFADEKHGLPDVEITECDVWDDKIPTFLHRRGIDAAKFRPCGLADIPEWTGKPTLSLDYHDPNVLKFLGYIILAPESNVDLYNGSIGKGKQDDCNCERPGSIDCVRSQVEKKWSELKRQLGSAFSEMGLDRMGEKVAVTWTKDEEMKFYTTVQQNLSSSKLWDKLLAVFHSKSKEDIVSYYYNVYKVRQRAHQNRLAPDSADS